MFRIILIALMAVISGSPIASAYTTITEYNIVYDEVTEPDGDGVLRTEQLKLDMYRPNIRTGRAPVLVYLHGGCFIRGSKSKIPTFLKKLSNAGVAVASIDYRMGKDPSNPEAAGLWNWPFPAGLKDVQQAVRFLRRNKDRWALDTDRMAAHGESAGGYLAAALGVRPITDRQDREDEFSRRVDIVSDWYGRTDFTLPTSSNGEACHELWLGTKLAAENAARFEEAGILPHVDSSSASRFQIMHGSRDPQVDVVHSVKLAEALRKVGIRPILYLNEGWPHGFSGSLPAEGMTSDFLLRSLGVHTSPAPLISSIRIQLGRTDSRGPAALPDFFQLDQYADPKMPGTTLLYEGCAGKAIAGAPSGWSPIYWDARYGKKFGYRMPLANGAYRLKLHFAECRYTKRGQRLFDIALFGIPMIRRYDTFASSGGIARADVQILHTIIRNGTLSLSFANVTNTNASIAAIEIERLM